MLSWDSCISIYLHSAPRSGSRAPTVQKHGGSLTLAPKSRDGTAPNLHIPAKRKAIVHHHHCNRECCCCCTRHREQRYCQERLEKRASEFASQGKILRAKRGRKNVLGFAKLRCSDFQGTQATLWGSFLLGELASSSLVLSLVLLVVFGVVIVVVKGHQSCARAINTTLV